MGLSLWIVPSRLDAERLKEAMRSSCPIVDDQPSDDSFPKFLPHVTLATLPGDTRSPRLRESIPVTQRPINISFSSVETGTHYFRSVYIAVKISPELEALHQAVHFALGVDPRTPAFPHVSLCYVTDGDAEKGHRFRFLDGLRIQKGEKGVALNCGDAVNEDWMNGFIADEIWVVRCEGPVETWSVLDVIKLHDGDTQ